ncbi:hypothetical protein C8F04DRAFT_988236 [Mycena alexandri]|uniref:Protein PBN1 n=1 Tax=Mycena alexandri TaxID=1745969 RepID=A0AAD6TFS8_9AGAR|nr:hypothetical protein C8F04DRAFT_988236 [Mycena alexandri]
MSYPRWSLSLSNRADAYCFKYASPCKLELPVAALGADSGALLLSITQPLPEDGLFVVEVPLHVRYGKMAMVESPFTLTQLSWPDVFVNLVSNVCTAER